MVPVIGSAVWSPEEKLRLSYKRTKSSSLTSEEAYKLLGLKKGASKEEVLKAANQLQKKIHPDMNRNVDSSRLSQLVNEAKEKIIKSDFS